MGIPANSSLLRRPRAGAITDSSPATEDRRYFLKILNRIEFEVTEEEYQTAVAGLLKLNKEEGPSGLSFHTSVVDGFFKDPKKEEVLAGDRT
jgi:hypothetical protein